MCEEWLATLHHSSPPSFLRVNHNIINNFKTMIMETKSNLKSSMMAGNQSAIYQVESFLEESYLFRRNVLNGKTEFFCIKPEEMEEEEKELEKKEENPKKVESLEEKNWKVLTAEAFNSIVRRAKKLGIGEKKSPRQDIEEYIKSDAVPVFDPIQEYMNKLPKWDGKNHVAALFWQPPTMSILSATRREVAVTSVFEFPMGNL